MWFFVSDGFSAVKQKNLLQKKFFPVCQCGFLLTGEGVPEKDVAFCLFPAVPISFSAQGGNSEIGCFVHIGVEFALTL